MRLTEDKIRRIAENLHDGLERQGILEYKDPRGSKPGTGRAQRIKEIYDFIVADLRKEEEIDAERSAAEHARERPRSAVMPDDRKDREAAEAVERAKVGSHPRLSLPGGCALSATGTSCAPP